MSKSGVQALQHVLEAGDSVQFSSFRKVRGALAHLVPVVEWW